MVYRGLVRDGVVVMETGVAFPEGTVVEVRAAEPSARVAVPEQTAIGLPEASPLHNYGRLMRDVHEVRARVLAQQLADSVL